MAAVMTLPILAPRPEGSVTSVTPRPQHALIHRESDWMEMYPEIERMYVRERRKLRYIMQYMERERGFKATEQMYKKRFTKWGFQKNTKRSSSATHSSKLKDTRGRHSSTQQLSLISASPGLGEHDGLKLLFLTSVQTWSITFFDLNSPRSGDVFSALDEHLLQVEKTKPVETIEISFAFRLVTDLLDRGQGRLAGRMARKAFLLVEEILSLQGPALLWNLLEMMYSMLTSGHAQLFQMLVAHLTALASTRIPETHPVSTMLRSLRGLIRNFTITPSNSRSPSPSSSSSSRSSSTSSERTVSTIDLDLLSRALPSILEQGWIFNAKVLFENFDTALMQLYCDIFWESCSITLPTAIINVAMGWLSQIEERRRLRRASAEATPMTRAGRALVDNLVEEDKMIRRLLSPGSENLLPPDYETLRVSSIAALRKHGDVIFRKGLYFDGDTTTILRILAGLVTARILDEEAFNMQDPSNPNGINVDAPRMGAGNVACAMRALMDLQIETDTQGLEAYPHNLDRIRAIVTLREYAQGKEDPQVMREMWQLEEALMEAGKLEEAKEVGRDVFRRLEKYVQDIPDTSI